MKALRALLIATLVVAGLATALIAGSYYLTKYRLYEQELTKK